MSELITNRVRNFRKNQTPSVNTLWQMLRSCKLDGYKYHGLATEKRRTGRYYGRYRKAKKNN